METQLLFVPFPLPLSPSVSSPLFLLIKSKKKSTTQKYFKKVWTRIWLHKPTFPSLELSYCSGSNLNRIHEPIHAPFLNMKVYLMSDTEVFLDNDEHVEEIS